MDDGHSDKLVFKQVVDLDERTADVLTNTTFESLMINPVIRESLTRHCFNRPSPVQAKALPLGLLGIDMLIQAKTGTGKTLVFAVLCADQLLNAPARERTPHVMIVSPTREIAMQSYEVIRKICPKYFYYGLFVGGIDMEVDKKVLRKGCQVAVGTSGRLAHLVKARILNTSKISLFVLDEADKLMEDAFQSEINFLFSSLTPDSAQVCVFSATYPRNLDQVLCNYMKEPSLIRLNADDCQLIGIKQYVVINQKKSSLEMLLNVLNVITFTQCLIFTNEQKKCSEICDYLNSNGILASHFSASLSQDERFKVMKDFKNFRFRILVSSDLSARGIDAEHVNLVVNVECPKTVECYLHRIGRAGRFGTRGAALTILSGDKECYRFKLLVHREHLNIKLLNLTDPGVSNVPLNSCYFDNCAKDFKPTFDDELWGNVDNLSVDPIPDEDINTAKVEKSQTRPMIVPLRPAHRTKYYLRKELLAIRNLATDAEWLEYGRQYLNFNESEIIQFLTRNQSAQELQREKIHSEKKPLQGNSNCWKTWSETDDISLISGIEAERLNSVENEEQVIQHLSISNQIVLTAPTTSYETFHTQLNTEYELFVENQCRKETETSDETGRASVEKTFPKLFERKLRSDYRKHISDIINMLNCDENLKITLNNVECSVDKQSNDQHFPDVEIRQLMSQLSL